MAPEQHTPTAMPRCLMMSYLLLNILQPSTLFFSAAYHESHFETRRRPGYLIIDAATDLSTCARAITPLADDRLRVRLRAASAAFQRRGQP